MLGINVLSLFDGMSCGQTSLKRLGIKVNKYFASEIDKPAMQITQKNHPNTIQLGDVTTIDVEALPIIDLIIAGSPCQGFSFAGKQLAFDDPRSALFFNFIDILEALKLKNPSIKFMLENVKMKPEFLDVITEKLGVEPVFINSKLVSAQSRGRYYWANWDFPVPKDRGVVLSDILEDLPSCPIGIRVREKFKCVRVGGRSSPINAKQEWDSPFQRISKKGKVKPSLEKAGCLTGGANSGGNHSDMDIIHSPYATRRYSVVECERLQTLPDGYTSGVSNTQAYKMLGNGWTVDVICEIFRWGGFPNEK